MRPAVRHFVTPGLHARFCSMFNTHTIVSKLDAQIVATKLSMIFCTYNITVIKIDYFYKTLFSLDRTLLTSYLFFRDRGLCACFKKTKSSFLPSSNFTYEKQQENRVKPRIQMTTLSCKGKKVKNQ